MTLPTATPRFLTRRCIALDSAGSGRNGIALHAGGPAAIDPGDIAPIRVLFLSRHSVFAARLREGLNGSSSVELVVGHLPGAQMSLGRLAAESSAKVVVADAELVRTGAIDTTPHAEVHGPELILLFDHLTPTALETVLHSHARGCLSPDATAATFAQAVHAVADGELWLPRWMLEVVYEQALAETAAYPQAGATESTDAHALTPREVDVLQLVKRGLTNKEVARQLDISPSTVKKHLHNALAKRGLFRRWQAYE